MASDARSQTGSATVISANVLMVFVYMKLNTTLGA
jgi:hypothetical protein